MLISGVLHLDPEPISVSIETSCFKVKKKPKRAMKAAWGPSGISGCPFQIPFHELCMGYESEHVGSISLKCTLAKKQRRKDALG